jgi:hypothetical protein
MYKLKKNLTILVQDWGIHQENHWQNYPSKLKFWYPQQEPLQNY